MRKTWIPRPTSAPPEPVRVPPQAELDAIALEARTGGQAYPRGVLSLPGMTLRDYFAAQVVRGALMNVDRIQDAAALAYQMADAMIAARKS